MEKWGIEARPITWDEDRIHVLSFPSVNSKREFLTSGSFLNFSGRGTWTLPIPDPLHASDEEPLTHRSQRVLQTHCHLIPPADLFPPTTLF